MKNYSLCQTREKQLQEIVKSFIELDGQEYTVYLAVNEPTPPKELNMILPTDEGLSFRSWYTH